jgi:hypothetical protein
MVVYNVFRALGLDIQVRAILDTESDAFEEYYQDRAENAEYDDLAEYEDFRSPAFRAHAVVGRLGGRTASEVGGSEEGIEEVVQAWGRVWNKVVWVNYPKSKEMDMVHMTVSLLFLI